MGLALCPEGLYMSPQRLSPHLVITIFGNRDGHMRSHLYPFLQTFLVLSVRKNELPASPALMFTWDFFVILGTGGFP